MNQVQATEPPQTLRGADTDFILGELKSLRDSVIPDPEVCIAILDGPVDLAHPCFADARITRADSLVLDEAGAGAMSGHGTHVASIELWVWPPAVVAWWSRSSRTPVDTSHNSTSPGPSNAPC